MTKRVWLAALLALVAGAVAADGRGRVRAIGDIAAQFAPGAAGNAPFPSVTGWCCPSP
jgi:hypothetical protein